MRISSSQIQKLCSEGGAGWVGSVFLFSLTKISCTCCWSLSWDCEAWCGVLVLGVVVCLVGRSGAWLVRRIHSGDKSHGLFSGQMCFTVFFFFLWSSVWAECCVWYLDLGSASAVLERDSEQV